MSLSASAVKKPITTALVFVALIVVGLFSLSKLSIDLLPDIESNYIMVLTSYEGASAADIETNVSKIMENRLNTVSDLKHITSQSKENISIISLEFEYGIDMTEATNDVRDKLDLAKPYLPDDADDPILFKFGTDDIPILMLSVTAEESLQALYKILDDKVVNPLQRISGVGAVSISGTPKREIEVYVDPQEMEAYHLSVETIANVIKAENKNTPGGTIDIGSNTYSMRVEGEFTDAKQMESVVVGTVDGRNIYLRDVAKVIDMTEERAQEAYHSGTRGGMIIIQKQSGANSVEIARKVHAALPDIKDNLPSDIKIGVIVDTSINIENTIQSLIDTIMITLMVVMFVVLVFLGRWRATVIIVITIPISLIASFTYLSVSGGTLNIISLSSLSIAIGMVVDDAIVVLENITTHIERGSKPKQAAIYATNEVHLSVIASTLTLLAVFLPLTTITGLSGVLFEQLGWIVSIIMIISTVCALTLTPMMCSQMLRLGKPKGGLYRIVFGTIEKGLNALDRGYARLLNWSVRHRAIVIIAGVAVFASSLMLTKVIGTEFFPTADNARISAILELPVGTRMEISRDLALKLDERWREEFPEIMAISFSVGQASTDNVYGSMQTNGSHIISFNLRLTSMEERDRSMVDIVEIMRKDLDEYSELKTYQVIAGGSNSSMSGQQTVDVDIYGHSFDETDAVSAALADSMKFLTLKKGKKTIDLIGEVNISREDYVPEYQVDFDREKLALNGLNMSTAASHIRNRINGITASYYREDGEEYDIKVRYDPKYRTSVEDIENILIYNNQGHGIRLKDLGTVVERFTPPTIERKDRERVVTVSGVVPQGVAMSQVVEGVNRAIKNLDIPSSVTLDIGGSYEEQQESFADLGALLLIIVILVFIVLASQFESFTYPFIIFLSLPFALTGVLIGLTLTGTALSIMALIGVIMLAGIVVKNGIVLVDYINLNRERGMSIVSAVVDGGKSRLRPVLMTTLTTVLGMLPMALGQGEGSEMWRPMGMTVWTGLAFSTLITLVLIPVVYCVFAGTGVKRQRKQIAAELLALEAESAKPADNRPAKGHSAGQTGGNQTDKKGKEEY